MRSEWKAGGLSRVYEGGKKGRKKPNKQKSHCIYPTLKTMGMNLLYLRNI